MLWQWQDSYPSPQSYRAYALIDCAISRPRVGEAEGGVRRGRRGSVTVDLLIELRKLLILECHWLVHAQIHWLNRVSPPWSDHVISDRVSICGSTDWLAFHFLATHAILERAQIRCRLQSWWLYSAAPSRQIHRKYQFVNLLVWPSLWLIPDI